MLRCRDRHADGAQSQGIHRRKPRHRPATSFNEIVDALNEALGTNHKPDYFDNPYSFYQNFTQADMSHHEKMTGFRCRYTTREGILDYVRNYLLKTSHEH